MNHQPEQKSETPRTDALRKTYFGISNANPETLLLHHEQLEYELNAARSEVENRRIAMCKIVRVLGHACNGLWHSEIAPKMAEIIKERDTLRKRLEETRQCLKNREATLIQSGEDWVKAKTETDTVKSQLTALTAEVERLKQIGNALSKFGKCSVERWYLGIKNTIYDSHDIAEGIEEAHKLWDKHLSKPEVK